LENTGLKGADPDEVLILGVARGDSAAMHALVARKLPRVSALAMRMLDDHAEAEDVAQEAFLRAWRQAPRWRSDGGARFDTWLHGVVLNLCHDRLRRRRRRPERPTEALPDTPDPAPGADRALEMGEASRSLRAALAELPERQRAAILLHHYQEMPQTEGARALGVSVDAFESLLARGRRALKTLLQEGQP
jgi:RNA polymerase sigma-70 factor (ECF subfamily)